MISRMSISYWLLAGALLGFGLMSAFSIGIPIFLLGMVLALYRVWRVGGSGFGLALVSMGLLPAIYLSISYFTADRSNTFYPDDWWKGLIVYLALAGAGAVWFLVEVRRSNPQPRSS